MFAFHQQIANGILMGTAAAIGLLCYFLGETKQRRAFLEAKKSLEVKMVIEEQSAEQVMIQFVHPSTCKKIHPEKSTKRFENVQNVNK